MPEYLQLLAFSDAELAGTCPLVMNLLVAKSIPSLSNLDISKYQSLSLEWAELVRQRLAKVERVFYRSPADWKNDVNFFRLGVLCEFLECEATIAYNDEQRMATSVRYTNPSDLFLNGVMDTRRGTCANMAALHVAIGRQLGWPVSLACVKSHFICRFDNGVVTYNIEATQAGFGGFKSDPDDYLIQHYNIPRAALNCGSDLRALTPREELGVFIGFRARHMRDIGQIHEAELDYLLARRLFPTSRRLYIDAMTMVLPRGMSLFEPGEIGSPESLAEEILVQYHRSTTLPTGNSCDIRGVDYTPIY